MRRSDLPYLDDLRAFETTARRESVRAAADEMALTHAAISRRISRLSKAVDAPLFEKSGRGIVLTQAGEALRDACRRSFDDLARTIATIRETKKIDDGAVLLSCERSVAMRWLIPRLSLFQDAFPKIAVHLSVGGALDERANRAALVLRRLDFAFENTWSVTPLFPEAVGPVMSAGMVPRFQAGDYVALSSRTRYGAWENWLQSHPSVPRPREQRTFDHHFLSVEAALGNLGVAMSPRVLALDDVERGRLVAPLGFDPDGSAYGLLYPADESLTDHARTLASWLSEASNVLRNDSLRTHSPEAAARD